MRELKKVIRVGTNRPLESTEIPARPPIHTPDDTLAASALLESQQPISSPGYNPSPASSVMEIPGPTFKRIEDLKPGDEIRTLGLVLQVRPFRERDLMLHILSPELGKICPLARHARGSRKRFPAAIDIFDRGSFTLTREKNGSLGVKALTAASSLARLRHDLDKLTLASLVIESFDIVLQEGAAVDQELNTEGSRATFEVLDLSLNAINEASGVRDALRATYIALVALGVRAGITDSNDAPPSSRQLATVMNAIETFAGRRLRTRTTVEDTIRAFARKNVS